MQWIDNHPYLFFILFLSTLGCISNVTYQICYAKRKKSNIAKLISLAQKRRLKNGTDSTEVETEQETEEE